MNLILRYIYIPIFVIAFILLTISFFIGKKRSIKNLGKTNKMNYSYELYNNFLVFIQKQPLLNILIGINAKKIAFATGLNLLFCYLISFILDILYIFLSLTTYLLLKEYFILWYTKLLHFISALLMPAIVFSFVDTFLTTNLYKQLPKAIAEIASAYRTHRKIKEAINAALPFMDKNIQKEFRRFSIYINSSMTFDEGINFLKTRIPNEYIMMLCSILEVGNSKKSDISDQLDELSIRMRNASFNKEASRRKILFIRAGIFLMICLLPAALRYPKLFEIDAESFYYTLQGNQLLSCYILFALLAYFIVYWLEKNV